MLCIQQCQCLYLCFSSTCPSLLLEMTSHRIPSPSFWSFFSFSPSSSLAPHPGTLTLITTPNHFPPVILPNPRRTTYPRAQTPSPPEPVPWDGGSEWGTAGRPPSSPRGAGVGLEDWADPSQMVVWLPGKKHLVQWWEGGRTQHTHTHTCTLKTDTRLTAWVLLASLMNTHSQTRCFISH